MSWAPPAYCPNSQYPPASLELLRGSGEYLRWTVTGLPPDATVEIGLDGGVWVPAQIEGDTIQVFAATPEMPDPPAGALALAAGANRLYYRVLDDPERVIRVCGTVRVLSYPC